MRLYPPKPKVGLRATAPNEAWHIDATIIKLLDGTKAYLHAVIDNYSRRILAWTVAETLNPMNTCYVLQQAAACLSEPETKVYMDSGVENLNKDVDSLLEGSILERVIAQIDVSFSNSLIEAWWRSLKHQWLFLNHLDSMATLRKLIEFYVTEHNATMPHSAFRGQTPDEMYFGRGATIPDELHRKRREAQSKRIDQNRKTACSDCPRSGAVAREDIAAWRISQIEGDIGPTQLHQHHSRMFNDVAGVRAFDVPLGTHRQGKFENDSSALSIAREGPGTCRNCGARGAPCP